MREGLETEDGLDERNIWLEKNWGVVILGETKAQRRERRFHEVENSLLFALNMKGKPAAFVLDRIDEYMVLWRIRVQLEDSIGKTHAIVKYDNGGGQKGVKINLAVRELPKISKRMDDILASLSLSGVVDDGTGGL